MSAKHESGIWHVMPKERWHDDDDADGDDESDDEDSTMKHHTADEFLISALSPLTLKTRSIVKTCPPGVRFWHEDPR